MSRDISNHNSRPSRDRIRTADLQKSIFSPKDGRVRSNFDAEAGTVVYTILGKEDEKDEAGRPILFDIEYDKGDVLAAEKREEACAKIVISDTSNRYYVKQGGNGRLLNLIGLYDENRSSRKRAGESQWKFREVNKKVFDLYLNFLKTKNKAWLVNAEREAV